ncbi:MAG TPA: hypothetical protein PKC12_04685 [Thiobacillaceae bacterium]|nr:hypothetical protein [Thiobacillaceae bacterium]
MPDLSPLEQSFPRLVSEIQAFWGSPACFDRLQHLLINTRGDRAGFPVEVCSDLMLLQMLAYEPVAPGSI